MLKSIEPSQDYQASSKWADMPIWLDACAQLDEAIADVWTPIEPQKIYQWALNNIKLPSKAAAEPGPLDFGRTPYALGILDEIEDTKNDAVIWIAGAQVSKTTVLVAAALKDVVVERAPAMLVLSTIGLAESFSKERLQPTIKESPSLLQAFGKSKEKSSENTILYKEALNGGHLILIGSNSSAELRSRPIKKLYLDEVSSYLPNKEGDVVNNLKQRQVTFFDSTTVLASTPVFKGDRIESEYEKTDQRRYFVDCPHCQQSQWLKWEQVKWPKDLPREAVYECEYCQRQWTEGQRHKAIRNGEWQPTATPQPGYEKTPGFHLSAIYSPWMTLAALAIEWMAAQGDRLKLQTFLNSKLAQGFEVAEFNDLDWVYLQSRCDSYQLGTVPAKGLLLTAGVDVQKDRLVVSVYAWGEGEESWLIAHLNIYGNPLLDSKHEESPWQQLDQLMAANYEHESGTLLKIALTNIDSGYATQDVYKYVLSRQRRFKVRAVDGLPGDREPVGPASYPQVDGKGRRNKSGLALWGVGVNQIKEMIYSRLNLKQPGPGFVHFAAATPETYFKELTGERIEIRYKNGFPYKKWVLKPGHQNHALDCFVYATAAAYHLRVHYPQYPWSELRAAIAQPKGVKDKSKAEPKPTPRRRRINKITGKPIGEWYKR